MYKIIKVTISIYTVLVFSDYVATTYVDVNFYDNVIMCMHFIVLMLAIFIIVCYCVLGHLYFYIKMIFSGLKFTRPNLAIGFIIKFLFLSNM